MKKKRNDRPQVKVQKQTKVAPANKRQVSDDNTATIEPPRRPVCPIRVPSFTKKRVASTEETAHSGNFKSEIRTKASSKAHDRPASDETAIFDDLYDSPDESLIIQAPIYRAVNGELEIQRPTKSVTEDPIADTPETSTSSSSFMKTLVTLFAGRRQSPPKPDKGKHHSRSQSVPTPVKNTDHDDVEPPRRAQSEYTPTPPLAPPTPPRLTHAQVIPEVMRRVPNDPSRTLRFREIPSAPLHRTTGGAVVFEDVFTPNEVQRGFNAPSAAQAPAELEQRRNKSWTMLDRNQDVWGRWHTKYEKREDHPFNYPAGVST